MGPTCRCTSRCGGRRSRWSRQSTLIASRSTRRPSSSSRTPTWWRWCRIIKWKMSKIQGDSSALRPGLGWLWFGCSTILPGCTATSAKFQSAQAELGRQWNTQNPSQPNPGLRADESPWKDELLNYLQQSYRFSHPIMHGYFSAKF